MEIKIYQGNALEVLKDMDSESIDMCMTSPPYWGLRDYGEDGQLGLEPTYYEYIDKLIAIFDEVKRVLKDTGTCWANLGDSYLGSGQGGGDTGFSKERHSQELLYYKSDAPSRPSQNYNTQAKSLAGIPERFVIAMTDAGWIRRNTIIWYKPSCMPSSVKDRFTIDWEYLYFFTKNKKYYFEQQFEELQPQSLERWKSEVKPSNQSRNNGSISPQGINTIHKIKSGAILNPKGRNKRCVWKIPTQSYSDAHFATYPEELCYVPIKAGCPKGGTVLDPFMGSGTTLKVARDLGRNGIGVELNQEYIKLAKKRINLEQGVFAL